ncbi:protein trichome birefringence-like 14 isoform X2 [Salvia miltiorrhiza]|uniref:protein trichome birefringence-like 14 isoform X2 n=1 Tax=Salvia miltiorrhiza TaxID=226208 RepID=UPI0025AD0538|nr:protein trichome birefringence-like 14 isoform X2 [Salvia miltiorrhiza]
MKGGIQGLKISQVSLILIGLVCMTVLVLAWTKTSFLAAFIPSPNRILPLDLGPGEIFKGGNISAQTRTEQVESFASPGVIEQKGERENIDNSKNTNKEENPSSVKKRSGSDELSEGKTKSTQVDIVVKNSSASESPVRREENGTLSSVDKNKESHSSVPEGTGSEEPSGGKNKSKELTIVPQNSPSVGSFHKGEQTVNLSATVGNKGCNYAKGKWAIDDNRPLYSGFGCKQWLSSMWACRLTQRMDFEYEKLRWQPQDCKMQDFTGSKFLQRMQDKTLAFIGDSLGRQQFQSLMCMVTGGEERADVLDVGREYGLVKARHAVRPDGWAYRFPITNTTILFYWSASLCDLEPINSSNPVTNFAMHLDRPPAFLRRYLHKFDVLVLNTGHHWNRGKLNANRWVMYVNGVPNTNRKTMDIAGAKNLSIHSIVKWVDEQLPLFPGLKAFLRSLSPRHFFNGDWNTGGTCDNTTPLSGGKEVLKDDSSDSVAAHAVRGTNVKLLDITALSELRDEGHISRYSIKATPGTQDCLHWCLPGIPDTWNEILFAQL